MLLDFIDAIHLVKAILAGRRNQQDKIGWRPKVHAYRILKLARDKKFGHTLSLKLVYLF